MRHPFRVGDIYGNRVGNYRVVSIDEPDMVVRYDDGKLLEGDIRTFARIWENMQFEAEVAQLAAKTAPKTGAGSQGTQPRKRKPGCTFDGLTEQDFKHGVTGTDWRSREKLGGLLAQELSDHLGTEFQSWAIYRRAAVYLTYTERYANNRKQGTHYAKFAFELGPEGARYGFFIERDGKVVDDSWDWSRFVAALRAEPAALKQVTAAMREHGVTGQPVLWVSEGVSCQPGRLIAEGDELAWSAAKTETRTAMRWSEFGRSLASLENCRWCDLYFYAEMPVAEAIALGVDIARRAVKAYLGLLPFYRVCVE